jgi:hypothetical protein
MKAHTTRVPLAIALVLAATLSLVLGPLGTIAHARSYRATLTIDHDQESDGFVGNLDTSGVCERGRLVSVYEVRSGADRIVGRDRTDRQGDYVVENARGLTGRFYARVRVSLRGDEGQHLCRGDRSETIRVTEP